MSSTARSGPTTIWKGSGPTLRASRWSEDPAALGRQGQGAHRGAGRGVRRAHPPLGGADAAGAARRRTGARGRIAARQGPRRAVGGRRAGKPAPLDGTFTAPAKTPRRRAGPDPLHRRRRGPCRASPRRGAFRLEPLAADAAASTGPRDRARAAVPRVRDFARGAVPQVRRAPCAMPGRCVEARPMPTLVLVRHGQSLWNLENRVTGWVDVPLTEKGEADA